MYTRPPMTRAVCTFTNVGENAMAWLSTSSTADLIAALRSSSSAMVEAATDIGTATTYAAAGVAYVTNASAMSAAVSGIFMPPSSLVSRPPARGDRDAHERVGFSSIQ